MVPQSAQLYREAVRNLSSTLTEPVERQEARALIAELLGGTVKVRQEGEAVYARLEMDSTVLLAAGGNRLKSMASKVVAGGRFELYCAYPIRVPLVPASNIVTG